VYMQPRKYSGDQSGLKNGSMARPLSSILSWSV
jgi:hypothetical protein